MNVMTRKQLVTAPFQITNPQRIPSQRYYDEGFYKLENERLWVHVWQMACRLEEIAELGDFVEYKILDKSVIVVRAKSGVKAFHNACRHRGVQLASGHGNCKAQGFVCPFHGWRFNLEGENTFVFGRDKFGEESLDRAELNLVPCRVEVWGGCAFINFDDEAPPLINHVAASASRLDMRNLQKMKVEWWRSTVLPVNWKLAMEAFMEGFHVAKTHPQLQSNNTPELAARYGTDSTPVPTKSKTMSVRERIDVTIHHMHLLSEGMGGMVHANDIAVAEDLRHIELPDDPAVAMPQWAMKLNEEITRRARARGVDMPDLNAVAATNPAPVEYVFPNYFVLPQFGNMASYRIRPLGPETCLFELWALTLMPENEVRERPVAPTPKAHHDPDWPTIPGQDYANLPLQQSGLHAKGFDYMRLAKDVEGMISNYHRLIDGYIGRGDPDALAQASQIVSTGLDAPIVDIGF